MGRIVIEIPEVLKAIIKPVIRDYVNEVARQVREGDARRRVDYASFEEKLAEATSAMERAGHQVALTALDVDAPRLMINDTEHVRVGRYEAPYKTPAGPVPVMRSLYRRTGDRNGETVNLVTLRSGAVADEWLPETARQMAHLVQVGPSREAEQTAQRLGRLPYSRSSFERVAHAVGEKYVPQNHDIEEVLIRSFHVPDKAVSVSVSLDRVSMPMEEPRPRPPGRPRKNAPKRPVERNYRMAYCGTVTLHNTEGESLHTIRYGCMPKSSPEALVTSMAGDVVALTDQNPELSVTLLCDGAPEMWNLLEDEFDAPETFGEICELIDYYHLVEKLSAATKVLDSDGANAIMKRWKLRLLNRNSAADEILEELLDSGMEHVAVGKDKPVHEAITYIQNNGDRMRYSGARRRGLPIGSGNVEATCKTLVRQRMDRAGCRWKNDTGDHVLHLRALSLSDRWDDALDIALRVTPPRIAACSA